MIDQSFTTVEHNLQLIEMSILLIIIFLPNTIVYISNAMHTQGQKLIIKKKEDTSKQNTPLTS